MLIKFEIILLQVKPKHEKNNMDGQQCVFSNLSLLKQTKCLAIKGYFYHFIRAFVYHSDRGVFFFFFCRMKDFINQGIKILKGYLRSVSIFLCIIK